MGAPVRRPLTLAALTFLVAYAWPILHPGVPHRETFSAVVAVVWALFAVDYAARLVLSTRRIRFFWTHLPDLAAVALPMLRPLRLLRLLTVLSVLNRHAGASFRGRVAVYVVGSTSLILLVASLGILDAERGAPGANIENFGDALGWSTTTITTVGYGDHYPVTLTGRFVAAGLMVGGIALLGVVTASFASWLLERIADVEEESRAATRRDVRELTRQVESLRRELEAGGEQSAPRLST